MPGYEIEAWYGGDAEGESRAYELGVGIAGVEYPFAQGYVQLREGERPLGIGARVGIPLGGWHEHQLFVRYDIPFSGDIRLLVDPALAVRRMERIRDCFSAASPPSGSRGAWDP